MRTCEACQRLFEEERQFRVAFATRRLIVPHPYDAEQRLFRALRDTIQTQPSVSERLRVWFDMTPMFFRVVSGVAAAGVILALLLPSLRQPARTPAAFTHALHYYQRVIESMPAVEYHMDDPQLLQAQFNGSGRLDFTTQVSDLRPAGYRLVGGKVMSEAGHPLAVSLYEEDGKTPLVCLRQRGTLPLLPESTHDEHGHYWYSAEGYTAMFTQFPDHFCVMISHQPKDTFVRRLQMAACSETMP